MQKITKNKLKVGLINFIGGTGYLFCMFLWLWVVLLYFSFVEKFINYIAPTEQVVVEQPVVQTVNNQPSAIMNVMGIITIVIVILLTIYLIYKIPTTIAKTSKNAVRATAATIAPVVIRAQHKQQTNKNYLKLTTLLVLVIKTLIIGIPIIFTYFYQFVVKQPVDYKIAIAVSTFFVCVAVLMFFIQYSLALFLKINKKNLW